VDLVDRLEADEQIRQLVARYAVAYDARDLETLAHLWAPDVRDDAMAVVNARLAAKGESPARTFHLVATPAITFDDADSARGQVVVRAEAEAGDQWIVAGGVYDDSYVRRGGAWYLGTRAFTLAYSGDVLSRPVPARPS
jgi:DNA-binding transcriptional regulator YbjK